MKTDIQNYLKLQTALINEKAKLEARLAEISKVIGQGALATTAPAAKRGGRRQFSEATKAKMRAAQQARWAKIKGKAATTKAPSAAPAPKKKRKMSAAGRAAIVAAAKARWARVKAAKQS